MSPNVHKILPPGLVMVAALYFGWPPSGPLLHRDTTARVTAVRWKLDDLQAPPAITITNNPFDSVLVVSATHEVEEETGKLIPATRPAGPDPSELQSGLALTGFADMAGRKWAIVNDRPRLPGDTIQTNDNNRHECELVSVAGDHVVVRCEETIAKIQIQRNRRLQSTLSEIGVSSPSLQNTEHAKAAPPPVAGVAEATEIPAPPHVFEAAN